MTPITLSKEQTEKLLEMCEIYFPDYKNINDEGILYREELYDKIFMQMDKIHWYEFCLTELAEIIFNPNPNEIQRGIKEKMCDFYWSQSIWWSEKFRTGSLEFNDTWAHHPVDYLFKEFKKQQMGEK